jgi:hypothetical protein
MYLEIGFGAYQFEKKFGRGKKYFEALDTAVKDMQDSSYYLLNKISPILKSSIKKERPILDTQGDFHLRSYERCSIYCIEYDLNIKYEESNFKNDFLAMLNLYEFMTGSLLLADVEDYVIDAVEAPSLEDDFKPIDFEPRVFKRRETSAGSQSTSNRRYSKKSDKVGKLGEEFVFKYEKKFLSDSGFPELAKKVIWHRQEKTNRTPGWDITSFDLDGKPKLIEVKASSGATISSVVLTKNELEKINEYLIQDNYYIYLVSDIVKNPKMEILKNPAKYLNEEKLSVEIESYSLLLGIVHE